MLQWRDAVEAADFGGAARSSNGACHNRTASYDADSRANGTVRSVCELAHATIEAEEYAVVWDSLVRCKPRTVVLEVVLRLRRGV